MILEKEALNDVQSAAVRHTDGPCLVFAGAGSGKTRVITYRIAYLLQELGVAPDRILALTFTNKAAGEMKSRLERMVGAAARDIWAGTFHAMCVRMLRRDGRRVGVSPGFVIVDESDQRQLIKEILDDLDAKHYSREPKERVPAGWPACFLSWGTTRFTDRSILMIPRAIPPTGFPPARWSPSSWIRLIRSALIFSPGRICLLMPRPYPFRGHRRNWPGRGGL